MTGPQMSDDELDRLLSAATRPVVPDGALARLNARIAREGGADNVVALQRSVKEPPRQSSRLGWLAGLPLAASLVLGIYLGSSGAGPGFLPDTAYELLSGVNLEDSMSGIDDVLSVAEESST
ncbi:MAG: hypothetical protein LCH46_09735 [Proteobacteria bacterium]|nr:hypothetical protein [Pseudomonadota bacterium]